MPSALRFTARTPLTYSTPLAASASNSGASSHRNVFSATSSVFQITAGSVVDPLEALSRRGPQPHQRKRRLHRVRRAQVLPVFAGELIERHHPLPVAIERAADVGVAALRAPGLECPFRPLGGASQQAEADVMVLGVVPGKKTWAWARASWTEPNRPGNFGRYFSVLNCASENRLSFDTRGRLMRLGHAKIREQQGDGLRGHRRPRSAWTVSCSRAMAWRAYVSRMNCSASVALSRCATIQPTT